METLEENPKTDTAAMRRQQIVAISVTMVLLLGGASLAWWKLYTPTPDEPLVDVLRPGGFGGGGGGGNARRAPPAPIRKTGGANSNNWEARADDARMNAVQDKQGAWRYSFRYQPARFRDPKDSVFLTAKYQSYILQLNDQQKKQLNDLPAYSSEMVVTADDRKKLEAAFQSYLAASDAEKPKKQGEVIALLSEVGKRSVEPSLAATEAYVAKIKSILTPEQANKLSQPRSAATRPAR